MKYFLTKFKIVESAGMKEVVAELIAAIAGECGYETFMDSDEGVDAYIQQDFYNEETLSLAMSDFPIENVKIEWETEEIEDRDWNETWEVENGFEPITIGEQLTVYDVLHTTSDEVDSFASKYKIGIEAKNAFGTGTHETTQMILSVLLASDMQGKRVLDCGCGTGILAIASLMLGAEGACAYDIDEWSVENTGHNAQLNGVSEKITVMKGDASVLAHVACTFDVVLANINRNILLQDMESFCSVMSDNGMMIISGFYESDVPLLLEKASTLGMKKMDTYSNGDWRCIVFQA